MIFELCQHTSIAQQYLSEIRDIGTQSHRAGFRKNIERLSMLLAYEISKQLSYEQTQVKTPLALASAQKLKKAPVIISVMRAGLSMHLGFADIFDEADFGFIGAYRKEEVAEESVSIAMEYAAHPDIEGRELILLDPMLATGKSIEESLEVIVKKGKPSKIFIASIVASQPGIDYLQKKLASFNYDLFVAVIDPELNEHAYIVPGLGDAGDLAFGPKL